MPPKTPPPALATNTVPAGISGAEHAWVISILACPLLGWIVASSIMVDWTTASWWWRSIAGASLGAGVPVLAAAWSAIVMDRRRSRLALLVVTCAPVAIFLPTLRRVVEGPRRVEATVARVSCAMSGRPRSRAGCLRWRVDFAGDAGSLFASKEALPAPGARACMLVLDDVLLGPCP